MNITNKYCNKLIKLSLHQNMREYGSEKPLFSISYAMSETKIEPINPNTYIYWLNPKILLGVYSEPSQTYEMEIFVFLLSSHSELFLKIGVTKEYVHSLKTTCKRVYFSKVADELSCSFKPANLIKVNSLTGIFQRFC